MAPARWWACLLYTSVNYKLLTIKTLLDSELLADVLRKGVLVNHEVHRFSMDILLNKNIQGAANR